MGKKFKTKEIVVVAMISAVIGVIFTLLDWAYMPMSAVLGTVFMEITFGVYMLSAALPMYIVRKPGFAVSEEIGYAILGKYEGNLKNMISGQILGAAFVFLRDGFFWGTPMSYGTTVAVGVIAVRFLSSVVIGIILVKMITAALEKTGVLKGFKCIRV